MWRLAEKFPALVPTREDFHTPVQRAADELLVKLSHYKPFIFHISQGRETVYIHFENLPNSLTHKLRVSNHDERARYGYKWQLRLDGRGRVKNPKQYRYYFSDVQSLVTRFDYYYQRVEHLNAELMAGCPEEYEENR